MAMTDNRLSITMAAADITTVKTALTNATAAMPFLIGLPPSDRQAMPKIDVSNKAFVEDAILVGQNNTSFLPTYISVPEVTKDLTLFNQLDELVILAGQLYEKLRDTQILAGSEAYLTALTIYRLFEAAANAGLPGADSVYEQLKQRFTDNGGSSNHP